MKAESYGARRSMPAGGKALLMMVLWLVGLAGWFGCASTHDGAIVASGDPATATSAPVSSTTVRSTTETSTTVRSEGTVTVADQTYQFNVVCYAPGAGEVVILGTGFSPNAADSDPIQLYVRAFVGASYFGLRLSDGTLVESSLDGPLDLYLRDDTIRASALRLVTDLNLGTGESTPFGFGEMEIRCGSYSDETPRSPIN